MSDDDDDRLCRFGTPLDPIKEDEVPSKKPITLGDQIAVDSNGRRRFHGAFTGGFSAGYWNTVGSKEGWTPQSFKSSRNEKASHSTQQADDFMDEEDVGEFGIAPQRIQTKDDFAPNFETTAKRNKRKILDENSGPIPGCPVLHLVFESCRDKAAVRLLKRMDPKIERILLKQQEMKQMAKIRNDPINEENTDNDATEISDSKKIYRCDMGPFKQIRENSDDSDESEDDELLNIEDLDIGNNDYKYFTENMKENRFGLEYVGLSGMNADHSQKNNFNLFPKSFEMIDKNNKRLSIKGQAFGVGAFEDDDDDIYAKDDITNYDFTLNDKSASTSKKLKAIEGPSAFIEGFVEASYVHSKTNTKLFYVDVSRDFKPKNWMVRRTRFGPEILPNTIKEISGRHEMTPIGRGKLLNEKSNKTPSNVENESIQTVDIVDHPSSADIQKDTETCSTISANNEAINVKKIARAKLETFTLPEISDRFVTSDSSESKPEVPIKKEQNKEIKIVRTRSTWVPTQLLSYKMNIEAAVGTKPEKSKPFSLFSCLTNDKDKKPLKFTSTGEFLQDNENEAAKQSQQKIRKCSTATNSQIVSTSLRNDSNDIELIKPLVKGKLPVKIVPLTKENKPKTVLEQKILDVQHEHPSEKKDIFKAIFDDSSNDEDEDPIEITQNSQSLNSEKISGQFLLPPEKEKINVLRNTSPPRGIFSNLLSKEISVLNKNIPKEIIKIVEPNEISPDSYGPTLPPVFTPFTTSYKKDKEIDATLSKLIALNSEVLIEEKWVEKESRSSEHKKKKHGDKHKKKNKKDHKKHKHKDRKKSKHTKKNEK